MTRFPGSALPSLVPLALLAAAASGCDLLAPGSLRDDERRLEEAVARWQANAPEDYRMVYRRGCFCVTEAVEAVEITVRGGRVEARRFAASGEPVPAALAELYLPVSGVFDEIRRAIRSGASELRATYHPTLGYPLEVFIDPVRGIADDEVHHWILELDPLP